MNAAVDADDGNQELRRLARNALREWKGRLMQVVSDGIERGEVRPDANPQRVAHAIISMLEGSLLISRLEESCGAREDARWILHALLDGIECRRSGS